MQKRWDHFKLVYNTQSLPMLKNENVSKARLKAEEFHLLEVRNISEQKARILLNPL